MISTEYLDRFPELPVGSMARRMHAMVAALDDFIGNTTQALKDTGMWGNTIFILHADNGAVPVRFSVHFQSIVRSIFSLKMDFSEQAGGPRSHQPPSFFATGGIQSSGGTAYPYRGAKFQIWEG